ncbi:ABC transporter permease [Anaerolineales bacterium]
MAATTASRVNSQRKSGFRFTRKRILALTLIIIGILLIVSGYNKLDFDVTTTLTFAPGPINSVPHIIVPTLSFMLVTGVIFILTGILGVLDITRIIGFVNGLMIVCGILIIPSLFIIASAGGSTNLTTMLAESLRLATPIAIGAMAGLWCERSGVVNIAIEGMMLFGACFGFTALFYLRPVFGDQIEIAMLLSVLIAVLTGGLVALLHAWLSITFATDQIVSGTVINILALGVTSFVRREYLLSTEAGTIRLPEVRIPILADIPIIGDVLFNNQPIFYMMFVIIIVSHLVLFHTRWGLRTRSVGEEPGAADTLGVRVNRIRWTNVFIGGLIAGLAGAWFSLEATGRFDDGMTRGAGFIALAALIFGKWAPLGALGGALLFGFSDSLGTRFQIIGVEVPVQFLQMVPYIVTIVVLAGLIGKSVAPKALGTAYKKE